MIKRKPSETRFVVCVRNDGYPASLELRKIYRMILDATAESRGYRRIVDESGEDYLYPADHFWPITLPKAKAVEQAFSTAL